MNFLKALCIMLLLLTNNKLQSQQNNFAPGINLTGYERFWEDKELNYKDIIADIDKLHKQGIKDIRLPVSFEYQFEKKSKRRFLRDLIKIVKYIRKKEMTLIVCYFDHTLDRETNYTNIKTIKKNWKYISHKLKKYSNNVYYEIVNEPNLYPTQWDEMVHEIVSEIRTEDKKTKILIGATNYNSIYELARKKPFPYKNLVYVFHFYEPFIFTHQGADWGGNQTKTVAIPYPYDSIKMPEINLKTLGTPGEINYKDYKDMANKTSLSHKINTIVKWAQQNNVELWCTEFGAINSIDPAYRCQYFKDVISIFKENNIKSYLWEYNGNFGIDNITEIFDCM
ncbi:glycoside hydrolase family 5 protein [Polaribacter sp. HaHaR_3_91]|uniref:glycoside hydrolase family 5 protein n=1 Tax=Polaribacter sp. HaHaR_3_91 TaxID=2745561 RepID=UPI001C4EE081|nr:cellulase family glycosylhydrolase [Polaribacter sp. HaHaR_3_91]QXP64943.1 cellulase family glycosylhydrolase [Polaribacter sp. HaHaR_3_91]